MFVEKPINGMFRERYAEEIRDDQSDLSDLSDREDYELKGTDVLLVTGKTEDVNFVFKTKRILFLIRVCRSTAVSRFMSTMLRAVHSMFTMISRFPPSHSPLSG